MRLGLVLLEVQVLGAVAGCIRRWGRWGRGFASSIEFFDQVGGRDGVERRVLVWAARSARSRMVVMT